MEKYGITRVSNGKVGWLYLRISMRINCPLFSLNFGIITLLPKQKEASHIKHFCPICLLNVSFKIFTKVMVNRMTGIVMKLINPSQTAFMLDRNIMEGMVMLHETIHEIHRKNDEWGHT
jgi:hypothetical protein